MLTTLTRQMFPTHITYGFFGVSPEEPYSAHVTVHLNGEEDEWNIFTYKDNKTHRGEGKNSFVALLQNYSIDISNKDLSALFGEYSYEDYMREFEKWAEEV
jgi:hypothetical protein